MNSAFKPLSDDDPLLFSSPLIHGVLKTAEYVEAQGGIGLTKSGAFNRKFVHWAAAASETASGGLKNQALSSGLSICTASFHRGEKEAKGQLYPFAFVHRPML